MHGALERRPRKIQCGAAEIRSIVPLDLPALVRRLGHRRSGPCSDHEKERNDYEEARAISLADGPSGLPDLHDCPVPHAAPPVAARTGTAAGQRAADLAAFGTVARTTRHARVPGRGGP